VRRVKAAQRGHFLALALTALPLLAASDDPNDPQNWSPVKKNIQLLVLSASNVCRE